MTDARTLRLSRENSRAAMRFVMGPVPEDPSFQPDAEGWNAIREPDPVRMQIIALPVMIATGFLAFAAIAYGTEIPWENVLDHLLAAFLIMIPIHELMHALAAPSFGTTRKTVVGFWPSRLLFYAHHDGELSRRRFMVILLLPTLALTVLPLLACVLLRWDAPFVAAIAAANVIGASGDLVGLAILLTQIPRRAVVRNKGWRTYWKNVAAVRQATA